jgi:hypothetical protein
LHLHSYVHIFCTVFTLLPPFPTSSPIVIFMIVNLPIYECHLWYSITQNIIFSQVYFNLMKLCYI